MGMALLAGCQNGKAPALGSQAHEVWQCAYGEPLGIAHHGRRIGNPHSDVTTAWLCCVHDWQIPVSAVAAAAQNEAMTKDPGATPSALGNSVKDLVARILDTVRLPDRNTTGPFRFAIDHCFPIRGQVGCVVCCWVTVQALLTVLFPRRALC